MLKDVTEADYIRFSQLTRMPVDKIVLSRVYRKVGHNSYVCLCGVDATGKGMAVVESLACMCGENGYQQYQEENFVFDRLLMPPVVIKL